MDSDLLKLFTETKLSDKQIKVYVALLQAGNSTVSRIANIAQLKRPNTYVIISELESMGYVNGVLGSKSKIYSAADPNKLVSDIKRGTQDLVEMLPYLRAIQKKAGKTHVQYYEGLKGAQEAFGQIYRPKEARYAISVDDALASIPSELSKWQKTYILGKARSGGKHLIKQSPKNKNYAVALKKGGQEVKYFAADSEFSIDIALIDGSIYIMSFDDNIHVTVINSESIYRSMCAVYDLVWANSKTSN